MLASGRISGQREHKGEIVATAEWPAIISVEQTATIRALLSNPARRTNRAARRYLLHGLLSCSHCGERLVARPRTGGQRRYACAKGVGFSGCGKTYITAEDVERFVTEAVLHRLDSPQLQQAVERRQRASRRPSAGGRKPKQQPRSWTSSPPPTERSSSRCRNGWPRRSRSRSG